MFNLIEAANQLKQLPDEALPQMMQGGDQSVPQYLVMSEIQRRKEIRSSPMMQPGQADRTTVADNMMQQGVPALPQAADQAPPEEAMGAGIAAFAGGGYVSERMRELKEALGGVDEWAGGVQNKYFMPYLEGRKKAAKEDLKSIKPVTDYAKERLDFADKDIGDSQRAMGLKPMGDYMSTPEEQAAAKAEYEAKLYGAPPKDMTGFKTPPLVPSQSPAVRELPEEAPAPRGAPVPLPMPAMEPAGMEQGLGALTPRAAPQEMAMPDKPTAKSYKDFMPEIEENMPDEYTDIIKRLESKKGSVESRRKDAMNLALISAGMGMLSSKSPNTMQGIGEGGMAGIASLHKGLSDANRYEESIDEQMMRAQQGKARDKSDRYKMAAGMANDENRFTQGIHREDMNNVRQDQRLAASEANTDKRLEYSERMANNRAEQQMRLEQYKQGQQNGRAASKSKGGGAPKSSAGERQIRQVMEEQNVDYLTAIKLIAEAKRKQEAAAPGAFKASDFKVIR